MQLLYCLLFSALVGLILETESGTPKSSITLHSRYRTKNSDDTVKRLLPSSAIHTTLEQISFQRETKTATINKQKVVSQKKNLNNHNTSNLAGSMNEPFGIQVSDKAFAEEDLSLCEEELKIKMNCSDTTLDVKDIEMAKSTDWNNHTGKGRALVGVNLIKGTQNSLAGICF